MLELPCKYFSQQNTHTTRTAGVSQTRYQSFHSALMPILSCRVWFPMPAFFSQPNDTISSLITILFPFSSHFPPPLTFEEILENCDSFFMTQIKSHSFAKSPQLTLTSSSALKIVCTILCCIYWFISLY